MARANVEKQKSEINGYKFKWPKRQEKGKRSVPKKSMKINYFKHSGKQIMEIMGK